MKPILFDIMGFGISSFFFTIMVGALAATFYAAHVAKRDGEDPVVLIDFGIIGVIASVIGARLFHVFVEAPDYYWEKPIRVLYFWQGGFVSLGAFIASFIGWMAYMKVKKLNVLKYLDIAVTGVPIIIFCVRVGCLLAGCCYGKPTDFFIYLKFSHPGSVPVFNHLADVHLHATQPYFMLNAVVMFVLLSVVYRCKKFHGQVLSVFLMYYGVSRFLIEFLRGDDDRGLWFSSMLSTGQIVMVFSFLMGLTLWISKRKNLIEQ